MKKILKLLKLREEGGAAMVIVAISMAAILGFAALAVDGGRLYTEKGKLQKALDAAVLAGAHQLNNSEAQAIAAAEEVSQKNGYPLTEADLTVTSNSIKASKQINVQLTLARAIGINQSTVQAVAKAEVGHVRTAKGIFPIAVEESRIPDGKELTCFENNSGNCGFLALDGRGASNLADVIRNGSNTDVNVGENVTTEPGVMWGPTSSSITDLINSDAGKPQCQSPSTADRTCNRVVNVAVIDTWDGVQGRDTVEVTGFATYWLQGFDDKILKGQFIERYQPGEIDDSGVGTLYGVKLVE